MPRLIDADKAKEVFTDYYHIHTTIQRLALEEAFSRIPTVEAIPKEWIRKWARKMVAETDNFNWGVYTLIMLEDWEKENEHK